MVSPADWLPFPSSHHPTAQTSSGPLPHTPLERNGSSFAQSVPPFQQLAATPGAAGQETGKVGSRQVGAQSAPVHESERRSSIQTSKACPGSTKKSTSTRREGSQAADPETMLPPVP